MHPVRRILCILVGAGLIYGGLVMAWPMVEAQRLLLKPALPAFALGSVGGLLVAMGVFPRMTRDW